LALLSAGAVFDNPENIQKSCHNFKQTKLTSWDPVIKQVAQGKNNAQKKPSQEDVSSTGGENAWLKRKKNHA